MARFTGKTGEEILAERKVATKAQTGMYPTGDEIIKQRRSSFETTPIRQESKTTEKEKDSNIDLRLMYNLIQDKAKKPPIPQIGAEKPQHEKPLSSGPEKTSSPIDLDVRPIHELIQEKAKKPVIPQVGAEKPASVPEGEIKEYKPTFKDRIKRMGEGAKRFLLGLGGAAGGNVIAETMDRGIDRKTKETAEKTGNDTLLRYREAEKEIMTPEVTMNRMLGKKLDYEPSKAEQFAEAAGEFTGSLAQAVTLGKVIPGANMYKGGSAVLQAANRIAHLTTVGFAHGGLQEYGRGGDAKQVGEAAVKTGAFFAGVGLAGATVGAGVRNVAAPYSSKFLPKFLAKNPKLAPAIQQLTTYAAGGAASGAVVQTVEEGISLLRNPEEFNVVRSGKNILKTAAFFALFDGISAALATKPLGEQEFMRGAKTPYDDGYAMWTPQGFVKPVAGENRYVMVTPQGYVKQAPKGFTPQNSGIYVKLTPNKTSGGQTELIPEVKLEVAFIRPSGEKVYQYQAWRQENIGKWEKPPYLASENPQKQTQEPVKEPMKETPAEPAMNKNEIFLEAAKGNAAQTVMPKMPEAKTEQQVIKTSEVNTVEISTGKPAKVVLYHGSGKPKNEIYNYAETPVAGKAEYWAFDENNAKLYGEKVESKEVNVNNPLVISNDSEWRALTKKAGWEFPILYGIDKERIKSLTERLKNTIISDGHDALVIKMNQEGDYAKTLRNMFGHDQVILYKQEPPAQERAENKTPKQEQKKKEQIKQPSDKNINNEQINSVVPFGRTGKKLLKKWAANEWVNTDLTDGSERTKDFIEFAKTYYLGGLTGARIIDIKTPQITSYFPPFLEMEFYNAGKEDAAKSKAKDQTVATNSQKQEITGTRRININKKEEPETIKNEQDEKNVKEGKNDEQAVKVRDDGEGALEGIQTQDVSGAVKEGEVERGAIDSTGTDKRRDVATDGSGDGLRQGVGDGEREVHSSSERGGSTESITGVVEKEKKKPVNPKGQNVTIKKDIELGGEKQRARDNIEAIKLMLKLEKEGRPATKAEQEVLLKYVGWGGLSNVTYTDYSGKPHRDWVDEHNELKSLVSAGEFQAIRESTLNAHYTSISVIKAMYEGLKHFGFKGGKILEPSMGIGHFFGAMPQDMAQTVTVLTGVELDSITGRIAKQLYPLANIHVKGFEETNLPDNYYDVAISNVPFGNYGVVDKKYPNFVTGSIHNYFFAKGLDKVRPGGLVMFITSRYTMDSKNGYQMRKYLADRADFLGAIRLPNTAFKANAKTEVVTDIIILRKREPHSNYNGESFLNTKPYKINDRWGNPRSVDINEYFVANGEMVLGEQSLSGGMYSGNEYTVTPLSDDSNSLSTAIKKSFNKIKGKMNYPNVEKAVQEQEEQMIPAPGYVKNGAFTIQNGKLYLKTGEYLTPFDTNPKNAERIKGLISIRDEVRNNLQLQLKEAGTSQLEKSRDKLNRLYDSFVKKYGAIHSRANYSAFGDDPDYPLLQSIEKYDEVTKETSKSDIFIKNTITPYKRAESAETGKEALIISLNEEGRVNLSRMEELTGKTKDELVKELEGLIFKVADGSYETAEKYLSGNVRQKLRDAEALADIDSSYISNVEALKKVQPEDKKAAQINITMGANWIPAEVYRDFICSTLSVSSNYVNLNYIPAIGEWKLDISTGKYSTAATSEYGTKRISAHDLFEKILNSKKIVIKDIDEDGKAHLNKVETLAAQEKAEKIKSEFAKWLWQDAAREKVLVELFNEKFNNIRLAEYDGSHLELPGHNPAITFRPHQKNAIWRILSSGGNTLLAHKVGAGKSGEMFGAVMELKRMGIVKKPLMVFPNHLVGQMGKEFLMFYPGANILVATKKDFEKSKRKVFLNRIATGNYDAVLIGQSQFGMIPMSKEFITEFYQEQIDLLESLIKSEVEAGRRGKRSSSEKQIMKAIKKLKTKMQNLQEKVKKDESVVYFEELGVDSLFVDEAHDFKNLMYATNMTNVSGLGSKEGSGKAFDLYMKVRYLQRLNGGRGVVFATATPVMNTMAEMFTMQRYLQPEILKALGLEGFDAWANTFGKVITTLEMTPEGKGFRQKEAFAKFVNMTNLSQLFRSFADVLLDIPGLKLPVLKGGKMETVIVEPSKDLSDYIDTLVERAQKVRNRDVDPSVDNMLKITSDGRKAALDMRLIDPNLPDYPHSKVNAAVDNVFRIWQETKKDKLTQIVFLDLSTPKAKKNKDAENEDTDTDTSELSVYDDIKNKLIIKGIPEKEIAFIHDADTDAKKLLLFENMNTGKIRILIGSTNKMGTGMNVQRLCKAMHHLDCPWRPGDIEQRNGRIVRQGNLNEEVEIYAYVTESSFDARMWDSLTRKQRFIEQALTSQLDEVEDVGEMTLSFQEIAAIASGNPLIQEQVINAAEVNKLLSLRQSHFNEQRDLQRRLENIKGEQIFLKNLLSDYKEDAKRAKDTSGDNFSVEIQGRIYNNRKEAGEVLLEMYRKNFSGSKFEKVGTFAGFDLYISGTGKITAKGAVSYGTELTTDGPAMFRALTSKIAAIPKEISRIEEKIPGLIEEQKKIESRIGLPFEKEEELNKALIRKAEIEAALNPEENTVSTVDETEDIDDSVSEGMPAFAEKPQRISSADTSINSQKLPAVFSKVKWKSGTINADLGGGKFDNATIYLSKLGVENLIWDPYNRDATHNAKVQARIQGGQADTATISNVLNVIAEEESRLQVIENAADVIKPSGVAYFSIYEGDRSGVGKETSKGFQLNRKTKEYIPEIQEYFGHVILRNGVIEARVPKKESDTEGLSSKLGQVSVGPATGKNVSGKAKRPSEIVKQFEQRLKATIKKGGVHWSRLGEFNNRTYIIRIAKANDIATLSHEVGHYFDKLYELTKLSSLKKHPNMEKIKNDLLFLGKETSKPSYSDQKVRKEGIAEFFRRYFTDSVETAKEFPELTDYVKSKVPQNVMNIVEEIAQDIWDLVNLDPVARGLKQIHFKGDPRAANPFDAKWFLRKIYSGFVDENYPLEWAAGELAGEEFKEKIKDELSVLRGWAGIAYEDIFGDYQADLGGKKVGPSYQQILKRVHENEQTRREYQAYKIARRSEDYFSSGKEMPDSPENYAEQIRILELKYPWFKEVFEQERKFDDNNFDLLRQAGLYSAEEIEAIKLANPNHVPLQRIKDAFDYVAGTSTKLGGSKNVVKKAKGSGEEIQDPEENMINNVFILRSVAMRNRLMNKIAKKADETEGKGYVMAKAPEKYKVTEFNLQAVKKYLIEVMKDEKGIQEQYYDAEQFVDNLDLNVLAKIFQPQHLAGANQVVIYRNGEPMLYDVHPDVFTAIKGLAPETMNLFTETLMTLSQAMKAGIIYTVQFISRNLSRDTLHNLTTTRSEINPIDISKAVIDVMTDSKWYKLSKRRGGGTNYFTANDRKFAQEAIDEMLSGRSRAKEIMQKIDTALGLAKEGYIGQGLWYGSKESFKTVLRLLQDWIEPTEMPGRVAETKKTLIKYLKAVGYTDKDIKAMDEQRLLEVIPSDVINRSIRYGRDLSVDFLKSGHWTKQLHLNRWINFFNPSIQGPVNVAKMLTNPKTRWRTVINGIKYLTLPALFLLWLNWENENYHRVKWYWRDFFFLIPLGDPKTTKYFLPFPKPWELGLIFSSIPERLISATLRDNPDAWEEFDESVRNTLLPEFMPSILEPIYHDKTGKNWVGIPTLNEGDKRVSPYLQYNEYTSMIAIKTAAALKDVPGVPGFMKSPKRLQQVIEGYTGTLGRTILEGVDITFGDKPGIPVVGSLKSNFVLDAQRSSRALDKFYNYKEKLDIAYNDANRLGEELPKDIAALRKSFVAGANLISIFNDSIRAIKTSDMPEAQKELEIAALRADMLETAWAISDSYEDYFFKDENAEDSILKKLLQKAGKVHEWVFYEDEDKELNKLQQAIRAGRK